MKNIQNHVTSLELSKRLKELGVPQNSEFYWSENEHGYLLGWGVYHKRENLSVGEWFSLDEEKHISAFLASELGDMLPGILGTDYIKMYKDKSEHLIEYLDAETDALIHHVFGETEADVRAKMLIYLIENNLYKVNDNI